ncbi:hypothetical protein BT96DRAFT_985798 [Gymnopus androsaceus JB14]|uniref:Ribonuclease H1 N-terminal domain-containing protein n=1 Tax=Gymnopus androsaceus JB14 TaxID=1447944 RepID=A0A6A4IHB6_9AGAR|nr:hypothetical protein BT96DRAFT_985798 [Gymnopus androsaceus JB14]
MPQRVQTKLFFDDESEVEVTVEQRGDVFETRTTRTTSSAVSSTPSTPSRTPSRSTASRIPSHRSANPTPSSAPALPAGPIIPVSPGPSSRLQHIQPPVPASPGPSSRAQNTQPSPSSLRRPCIPHPDDIHQPLCHTGGRFYVVYAGLRVGIFGDWWSEAYVSTNGIRHLKHRSFDSFAEALAAYRGPYNSEPGYPPLKYLGEDNDFETESELSMSKLSECFAAITPSN